jgi:hypothetical protein
VNTLKFSLRSLWKLIISVIFIVIMCSLHCFRVRFKLSFDNEDISLRHNDEKAKCVIKKKNFFLTARSLNMKMNITWHDGRIKTFSVYHFKLNISSS